MIHRHTANRAARWERLGGRAAWSLDRRTSAKPLRLHVSVSLTHTTKTFVNEMVAKCTRFELCIIVHSLMFPVYGRSMTQQVNLSITSNITYSDVTRIDKKITFYVRIKLFLEIQILREIRYLNMKENIQLKF